MFFGPCQNLLRFATSADVTKFAWRYIREPTGQSIGQSQKRFDFPCFFMYFVPCQKLLRFATSADVHNFIIPCAANLAIKFLGGGLSVWFCKILQSQTVTLRVAGIKSVTLNMKHWVLRQIDAGLLYQWPCGNAAVMMGPPPGPKALWKDLHNPSRAGSPLNWP
jgi:hypothetical protein